MDRFAYTPEDIADISHILHDHWFDIDAISTDVNNGTVSVSFSTKKKLLRRGIYAFRLIIRHVCTVDIRDSEKVGFYDLQEISFDRKNLCACIQGNIPVEIQICVSQIEMILVAS